jgi:hypothetical protein
MHTVHEKTTLLSSTVEYGEGKPDTIDDKLHSDSDKQHAQETIDSPVLTLPDLFHDII